MKRITAIAALAVLMTIPATAQDVIWRIAPEPIPDLQAYFEANRTGREDHSASETASGVEIATGTDKLSNPGDFLFLPSYEVDTTDPGGESTVFAVRHAGAFDQDIILQYFDRRLIPVSTLNTTLSPNEILPINIRDVSGISDSAEEDGFARGFVRVRTSGNTFDVLTGDYFQVNPGQNFATGGRLIDVDELCHRWGIRYLNGGVFTGGTNYRMLVDIPLGGDPDVDDPTLTMNVRSEAGALLATVFGFTDDFVFDFTASEVVGNLATSGSLNIFVDENAGSGGILFGNFSANGRFSVGIDGVCEPPLF